MSQRSVCCVEPAGHLASLRRPPGVACGLHMRRSSAFVCVGRVGRAESSVTAPAGARRVAGTAGRGPRGPGGRKVESSHVWYLVKLVPSRASPRNVVPHGHRGCVRRGPPAGAARPRASRLRAVPPPSPRGGGRVRGGGRGCVTRLWACARVGRGSCGVSCGRPRARRAGSTLCPPRRPKSSDLCRPAMRPAVSRVKCPDSFRRSSDSASSAQDFFSID